jgi:hypothetical protein
MVLIGSLLSIFIFIRKNCKSAQYRKLAKYPSKFFYKKYFDKATNTFIFQSLAKDKLLPRKNKKINE